MRQHNAYQNVSRLEGMTTGFGIVPIEEIPAPDPSDATSGLRPVVLVVVSEPETADELAESLGRNGYAAIAAYEAETALETALLMPPDLVAIDAGLSGSSGVDLAASLREKLPDCTVVMFEGDEAGPELVATVKWGLGNRV